MDLSDIDNEPIIRGREAAKMLHISMKTLKNWIKSGYIRGKKIGGRWYIESDSLRELLKFEHSRDPVTEDENDTQNLRMNW